VEFAPGAQPTPWPVGSHGGFNATYYFVRWQADLIVPPRVPLGQPPAAPLRARIYAVSSVRALRQGECGERFWRMLSNESLQLTSARSTDAVTVEWLERAQAGILVRRLESRLPAAALGR
jgi:hypothetical protein